MKQFSFDLQRFAGETFIPDEGTQLLTISGNVLKPASESVLSGNTLSFGGALPSRPFNDYTWEEISVIAQTGSGANYFNIGDCKEITLNGNIGDYLTLDNEKLCVYILHFNYPMNGTADNNIILGGFKTANGMDIALCDSKYDTDPVSDSTISFNMNHSYSTITSGISSTSCGGWKGSDFRYDILGATSTQPSDYGKHHTTSCVGYNATAATLTSPKSKTLLAALPSDFRNALRLWSRWIDAKGKSSNVEANIEETIDAVTLLTEFEIYGARTYANEYEKNHQSQMAYYRLSNSKIKYNHSSTSSAVWWWLASPRYDNSGICCVDIDGSVRSRNTALIYALAPAFKI